MEEIPIGEFTKFLEAPPGLEKEGYLDWLKRMRHLGTFWTRGSKETKCFALRQAGKVYAAGMLRRVGRGWEKTELRELYSTNEDHLARFIEGLRHKISEIVEWRHEGVIASLGYRPVKRSVLIGWGPFSRLKKGNEMVRFHFTEDENLAKEIQLSSWGFYVPPRGQDVVVGFLKGEPVCSAYLNPLTGNIDFGVHVKKKFQRMRIGTACLAFSIKHLRGLGFKWVYVVRVLRSPLRLYGPDKVALDFYLSNGGKLLRDYRLYR